MDIMCHNSITGRKWIYYGANNGYSGVGWSKNMWWCTHAGASLYIGDFNGDSRDDILCHDKSGHVFIAYADNRGRFTKTGWHKAMGFCKCSTCSVFIGDFNGDRKSDLLCHDGLRGSKRIAYATSSGNFQNAKIWSSYKPWCYSRYGPLLVGDFNGDGRDDLYCYDKYSGNTFTAYAKYGGSFGHTDNADNMGWCTGRHCTLSVGVASRDHMDDLICRCKTPSTEPVRVRFPVYQGFEYFRQWRRNRSWCNRPTEMILVGRLKPKYCGSLVCIDKATGKYSIAFT